LIRYIEDEVSEPPWPWTRENTCETVEKPDYPEYHEFKPDPGERFKFCITFCRGLSSTKEKVICYATCAWGAILDSLGGMK
jgi:hypothetical protein